MKKTIFLTGATGLVGGNLIQRILHNDETAEIVALVRCESLPEGIERLKEIMEKVSPSDGTDTLNRVQVIPGDITEENLGLSESSYNELAARITHIVHSAASVRFDLPLEEVRKVNVEGTKKVARLAFKAHQSGRLERFAYVSTAYVSGNRSGIILEDEQVQPDSFSNTYERAKFEADQYVRSLSASLPVTVFRPSIIVGDSLTGRTTAFNVLYPVFKMIQRGLLDTFPGDETATLDVVPVDFVCDALCEILFAGKLLKTVYHLTAGRKASTIHEVFGAAARFFARNSGLRGTIKFLGLKDYKDMKDCEKRNGRLLQLLEALEPYVTTQQTFDTSNTVEALRGSGIEIPEYGQFIGNVLQYFDEMSLKKQQRKAA